MNGFGVVIALAAVAGIGWLLTAGAWRILRRYGVRADEHPPDDADRT
jgi:hypothetical protein